MLTESQLIKISRFSAWYDIVVTTAFATPWTFVFLMGAISEIATRLSLPGSVLSPDVFHIFFANLFGTVVVIWSVVRLRLNLSVLARYDAIGRFLFSTWMVVALANGASYILIGLLVIEFSMGVIQALPLKRTEMA